jgi:hypothetical protein
MTEPVPSTRSLSTVRDVLIVLAAVALTLWTLIDDTLPAWLLRLSIAGAVLAGFALALMALQRLSGRP